MKHHSKYGQTNELLKRNVHSTLNELLRSLYKHTRVEVLGLTNRGDSFNQQYQLMRKSLPKIIFDVGANRGQTTVNYLRYFLDATIYGFEPYPPSFEAYKTRFFGLHKVIPVEVSLSDKTGVSKLYCNDCDYTNSLLKPLPESKRTYKDINQQLKHVKTIYSKTITLDKFTEDNRIKAIDILKMDTQGSELRILKGAARLLKHKMINIIYTEIGFLPMYEGHALFSDIETLLRKSGYILYDITNCFRDSKGRLISGDAIFLSPEFKLDD